MANYLERSTPLSIFDVAMTEEYRTAVARRCLEHLAEVSPQTRRCLQIALRKHIRLPGFPDPNDALKSPKRPLLLAEVVGASHRSVALMGALLRVWDESHADLHQEVLAYLRGSDDPVDEPATVDTRFPRVWPQAHMLSIAANFVEGRPTFDRDDAALMMCYLYGRAPIPDELLSAYGLASGPEDSLSNEPQDVQSDQSPQAVGTITLQETSAMPETATLFQAMLAQLHALPPDALEWEQLPAFTASLEALRDSKLTEREHGRVQLREALAALICEADAPLAWWGYDVTTWSADCCAWSEAEALAHKVRDWQVMLLRYDQLRQVPASKWAEKQPRREVLTNLEIDIERTYPELRVALSPGVPGPSTPSDVATTTPTIPPEPAVDLTEAELESAATADLTDSAVAEAADLPDQIMSLDETDFTLTPEPSADDIDLSETALAAGTELPGATSDVDTEELTLETLIPEEPVQPSVTDILDQGFPPLEPAPDLEWRSREKETAEAAATAANSDLQPTPEGDAVTPITEIVIPASLTVRELADKMHRSPIEIIKALMNHGLMVPIAALIDFSTAQLIGEELGVTLRCEKTPEPVAEEAKEETGTSSVIVEADIDEAWLALLCQMMADDDLSGAYWLVKSLSDSGRPMPAPDSLLAAVQGSRCVTADTPGLARDLLQITRSHSPSEDTPAHEILGLAAALRPALVAPSSGMVAWLQAPASCPAVRPLVLALESFAAFNVNLQHEDVLGVAGEEQRTEAILEASRAVRRWLDEAPTRKKRVSSVWRNLVGPRGALKEFLLPMSENRQEDLDSVLSKLAFWQDRPAIYQLFDEINRAGSPGRPQRVTGAGKQDLYREVEEASELAERWCSLVQRAREIEARGDWFRDQVTTLRDAVEQALPDIDAALDELAHSDHSKFLASCARVLQASIKQLRELLDLAPTSDVPAPGNPPLWALTPATDSLDAILADRLLWVPELSLTDSGMPATGALHLVASSLRVAQLEGRTLRSAIDLWLSQQDYRFAERLMAALPDESTVMDLQQRLNEALSASRAALRAKIGETSNLIDQALLDEAIDDEQRARHTSAFASLSLEEVRNFRAKFAQLDEIQHEIRDGYQRRLQHLREEQESIANRLEMSHIAPDLQGKALAFVASALERQDVRVVVESLARLREVLDRGADLPEDWYAPASDRDCLSEFNAAVPGIERWLENPRNDLHSLAVAAREGTTAAGIQFGGLSEPRRKETIEALLAWRTLKQPTKSNKGALIATVLRYLGFDLRTGDSTSVEILDSGENWMHARASMSAHDQARPISEFGSQAQDRYDVICLWERPSAETIATRLQKLNLDIHTVIVFYLGRITARQKRTVVRVNRDQDLAIAILDETLLVFLAQEPDVRLPTFLRCALPFSALNPYRPFQAGDVPPEMFFGRAAMARELQRQGGSCLVYGGRQLGKSALLRHVQRQFHHPEREQFAWVENMKLIFDPSAGKTSTHVWRSLREGFKAQKLLDSRISTDKPEEIARYIRDAMRAKPRQRVLVMLDEADGFLDADAKEGFSNVIKLRDLMLDSGQRFKVIFAGLQGVQRFQGIPDQPLAHFGTPLCVGPLEPDEAQLLVRQPLEALGYRFADDGAVLRILSYTNYHPGLIQYFCQELLKQLRDRSGTSLPPYRIQQEDIESVYRVQGVRDRIRERFEWTLALDTHYQAIAWTLIEDQIKDRDGYARAYPPSDVLQLVREWWPAGFENTESDQLRGWLDELCGLGVLVRNARGHYRLRSPNMVRLLGRETDIEDRLEELMTKSPIPVMEADSHHAPLDEEATRYSPLTYAEERGLSQPRFGVGLVFASEALGFNLLPGTIRRFLPVGLPAGAGDCTPIPGIAYAKELDEWLGEYLNSQAKTERMLVYQQVPYVTPQALSELVNQAQRFCQRHQAKDRWLRVLFLFDSQCTWQWLGLPQSERTGIEEAADAVLWPRPWTLSAIRRRLAQHDKLDTDDAGSQEALRVTSGWPYLLDELFNRCGKETDLKPTAQELQQDLKTTHSRLAQEFMPRLGVAKSEVAQRVLDFILKDGEGRLPEDLLTPEMLGGTPQLTVAQCGRAKEFLLRLGLVHLRSEVLMADPIVAQLITQA